MAPPPRRRDDWSGHSHGFQDDCAAAVLQARECEYVALLEDLAADSMRLMPMEGHLVLESQLGRQSLESKSRGTVTYDVQGDVLTGLRPSPCHGLKQQVDSLELQQSADKGKSEPLLGLCVFAIRRVGAPLSQVDGVLAEDLAWAELQLRQRRPSSFICYEEHGGSALTR